MTTLVVSDLHLGAQRGADVARRPALRAPLLEALDGVEHLVLLGDVLELRDGPRDGALEADVVRAGCPADRAAFRTAKLRINADNPGSGTTTR